MFNTKNFIANFPINKNKINLYQYINYKYMISPRFKNFENIKQHYKNQSLLSGSHIIFYHALNILYQIIQ